ncbi:M23 family metallopeptidase [Amycolatopsis roodepoortensis]|uniref:M23 family metallopeptidase n=1 Tax=Amycolatopsis roodepoortensis TaxID=700274 RepID=UPI0027D7B0B0|nr:M23 family metallopeptidase [Amycolatopsis roodepoortensis]
MALTTGGGSSVAGMLLPVVARPQRDEVVVLRAAERVRQDRVAREKSAKEEAARKQAEEAARKKVYPPVTGVITSNFGPRWGSTHYGLDIANKIGTPIRTPLRGTVVDAGPASGFGLWVRIRHDDGTVTVYGHINDYGVRVGQRVEAGQVIAEVGNKGISTGPHLHFEVWEPGGRKADPLRWLKDRGADIGDER